MKILASVLGFCFLSTATFADDVWLNDIEEAKKVAQEEEKDLLLLFVGSDWCSWCERLEKNVLSKEEFLDEIQKEYVLVKFDFPRKIKQSKELKAENARVRAKYPIKGFPSIWLTDEKGKAYGQYGYRATVEQFLEGLKPHKELKVKRDKLIDEASELEGLKKVQALYRVLSYFGMIGLLHGYEADLEKVIAMDEDNEAKVKLQAQQVLFFVKLDRLAAVNDFKAVEKLIEETLENAISVLLKQAALDVRAQLSLIKGDKEAAVGILKEALALDPKSRLAEQLKKKIETIRKQIEEEESEEKSEEE